MNEIELKSSVITSYPFLQYGTLHTQNLNAGPYQLTTRNQSLRFNLKPCDSISNNVDNVVVIELSYSTGKLRIICDVELLSCFIESISLEHFQLLEEDFRIAFLYCNNKGILDNIESLIGIKLGIESVIFQQQASIDTSDNLLQLEIYNQQKNRCGEAYVEYFNQDALKTLLMPLKITDTKFNQAEQIPIVLNVIAGRLQLSVQSLNELNVNDIILLEVNEYFDDTLFLSHATTPLYNVTKQGQHFTFSKKTPLINMPIELNNDSTDINSDTTVEDSQATEYDQSNPIEEPAPDLDEEVMVESTADEATTIDSASIPVNVEFSLGTVTKSLADINALEEGALLELDKGTSNCVDILVNGKKIGVGEPVSINEKLGIRIVSFD